MVERASDLIRAVIDASFDDDKRALSRQALLSFVDRFDRLEAECNELRMTASTRVKPVQRDNPRTHGGGSWSTIRQVERMAQNYAGDEFAGLMGTCNLLRHLFKLVRDGKTKQAKRLIADLDS